jgi:hemerythrin-like domain-containing protein
MKNGAAKSCRDKHPKGGKNHARHQVTKSGPCQSAGTLPPLREGGGQHREIAEQIFTELEMHTTLEEELFYPALRSRVKPETRELAPSTADEETEDEAADLMAEDEDLVTEALEEHREVKTLIATLRALNPGNTQFQGTFAELREGVEAHVGMEEDELMPDAEAVLGDELERLGRQMEERKQQLMAGTS